MSTFCVIIPVQFACALLMLGEKLNDYDDVKDILLEMGIYFQVQVSFCAQLEYN